MSSTLSKTLYEYLNETEQYTTSTTRFFINERNNIDAIPETRTRRYYIHNENNNNTNIKQVVTEVC